MVLVECRKILMGEKNLTQLKLYCNHFEIGMFRMEFLNRIQSLIFQNLHWKCIASWRSQVEIPDAVIVSPFFTPILLNRFATRTIGRLSGPVCVRKLARPSFTPCQRLLRKPHTVTSIQAPGLVIFSLFLSGADNRDKGGGKKPNLTRQRQFLISTDLVLG